MDTCNCPVFVGVIGGCCSSHPITEAHSPEGALPKEAHPVSYSSEAEERQSRLRSHTLTHGASVPFARNVSSASASTDADSVGLRRADIFLRRENTFRSYRRRYSARAYLARILGTLRETHVSDSKGKRDKEAEKAV